MAFEKLKGFWKKAIIDWKKSGSENQTEENKQYKSTRGKGSTNRMKKVKRRVVENSFRKVKTDVKSVKGNVAQLVERVVTLESQQREEAKERQNNSRWIQHHIDQFTSISAEFSTQNYRIERLEQLPKDMKQLRKEFADLLADLHIEEPSDSVDLATTAERKMSKELLRTVSKTPGEVVEIVTPYSRRAFFLIVKMARESTEDWIPRSSLSTEMYPDREDKALTNTLANLLKPLYDYKLIERKRIANAVFLRPTDFGLSAVKEKVTENQSKRVDSQIRKIQKKRQR